MLLISYDLIGQERPAAYEAVRQYIETHALSSIRPLFSQWLVETSSSPQDWSTAFTSNGVIDASDRLFILQVQNPYFGRLGSDDWAWLSARV